MGKLIVKNNNRELLFVLRSGDKHILTGIIFMLIATISDFFQLVVLNVNYPILRYFLFFVSAFYLIKGIIKSRNKIQINIITKVAIFVFLIYIIISIFRGFQKVTDSSQNYLYFKRFLSGDFVVLIIPFLILIKPGLSLYRNIFRYLFIMTILGIIFVPLVFIIYNNNPFFGIENLTRLFTSSGSILILTTLYHKKRTNYILYVSFIIALIFLMLLARRNMIVYVSTVIFFGIFINTFYQSKNKLLPILYMLFLFGIIASFFYFFKDNFGFAIDRFSTGFDSRTTVLDEFIFDFNKTPSDWIFGRGLYGEYYSQTTAINIDQNTRDGIENGYLNHILFGGWIYLGSLILISLPAIFLGFFKSRNILSKAFAAIIVIYFVDMIGFGLPAPHIKYLMIFISISGCYSTWLRNLPDRFLKKQIGI